MDTLVKNKKMPKIVSVVDAEYLTGYKVKVSFSDGHTSAVDFSQFLLEETNPVITQYRNLKLFKKFNIVDGDLVWGINWDLIFPVQALYYADLNITCNSKIKAPCHD